MTDVGDVVLVYTEGNPAFFARIEEIAPDVKPEWFHVKMLVLQVPLLVITWILRQPYIDGEEFTMGGRPVRLVKVVAPTEEEMESTGEEGDEASEPPEAEKPASEAPRDRKVVSLLDRKKKDHSS